MLSMGEKWSEKLFTEIPDDERTKYYMEQFADCINCGACKEVCPVCTCGEDSKCTMYHNLVDNYRMSMFHMVRLMHLSDSCIGCGQCTDVCPVDIPVTTIFRRFADKSQKKYNYKAGMTLERPPFLEVMPR
jgi:formate dehydrogenase subunit beta